MRPLPLLVVLLAGCRLYAPALGDCALQCGEGGACPDGFSCRGTWCRPAQGATEDCACRAGISQPCGTGEGACVRGVQACLADGTWGACVGGVGPSDELCDGEDNDCDGLVDVLPVSELVPPQEVGVGTPWQFYGHAAGYTALVPLALPDAGLEVRALLFDAQLRAAGRTEPLLVEKVPRISSRSEGTDVYAVYWHEAALELARVAADGGVERLGSVADAGTPFRVQMGLGPSDAVATWVDNGTSLRVITWPRDGGLAAAEDLTAKLAGVPSWADISTDGRYLIAESTPDGGGYSDQSVDLQTGEVQPAAFWMVPRFVSSGDKVVHLDILDYTGSSAGKGQALVFGYSDYVHQTFGDAQELEQSGLWHDLDFNLEPDGSLLAAYVDEQVRRVTVTRREVQDGGAVSLRHASLPGEVVVTPEYSYMNLQLAHVPGDGMYTVAWWTHGGLYARRFCAP